MSDRNLMNEVAAYLRIFTSGCEFARIEPQILRDLNLSKKDSVRPEIRKLRMAGMPIASGPSGYWFFPPTFSESDIAKYEEYLGNLENRAIKIYQVRKAQIAAYNKRAGKQLELRNV